MSQQVDLLGEPYMGIQRRKHWTRPNGYIQRPGFGPAGETCKSCQHAVRFEQGRSYYKCSLLRGKWTHSINTDILAGSPACARWEKKT